MDNIAVIKPARVKLGGLWRNETKNGKQYLSGTLGYDTVIEVWPNIKRDGPEGEKDPDFQIFLSQKMKKTAGTFKPKDDTTAESVPF